MTWIFVHSSLPFTEASGFFSQFNSSIDARCASLRRFDSGCDGAFRWVQNWVQAQKNTARLGKLRSLSPLRRQQISGGQCRTRTCDLLLVRQAL